MEWKVGSSYEIAYVAENGQLTERRIDLISASLQRGGQGYLYAYCHLRGAERTFRTDRIRWARDLRAESSGRPGIAAASRQERTSPVVQDITPWRTPESSPDATNDTQIKALRRRVIGLCAFAAFVLFVCLDADGHFESIGRRPAVRPGPPAVILPQPVAAKSVVPNPPPKPLVEETMIAGLVLRTRRIDGIERYEVPAFGLVTTNKLEAIASIRLPAFVEATGLTDPALIGRYLEADLNGSGRLSFDELSVFQRGTYNEFRYEGNPLALRPDQFLAAGGGDCEDFALYTAGLLRFWGWEPYLGSMGSSRGSPGHAVCLSFEGGSFPGGFSYFDLSSWNAEDGTALKDGKYVPIDYDQVGGLSNAVKSGWKLRSVYVPEKAWGLTM